MGEDKLKPPICHQLLLFSPFTSRYLFLTAFAFSLCRSFVYLEIDNRKCSESSKECFSNTHEAASFIAAAHIKDGLRYPLVSVNSSKLQVIFHLRDTCVI